MFLKYAKDCIIECNGDVNIGFYVIDTQINAKNIIVSSRKGKIIGGKLNAKSRIISNNIGNKQERPTFINVEGFNRKALKKEMDDLLNDYKNYLSQIDKNRRNMTIYENSITNLCDDFMDSEYYYYQKSNDEILKHIAKLEERRKELLDILKSKGEGEVTIFTKAYPRTILEIKKIQKIIRKITCGTFYSKNNEVKLG